MQQCFGCGKDFEDHNVRLLMCNRGCTYWFHNYPKRCLKEWIEEQTGIVEITKKLAEYRTQIGSRDLTLLDQLGLNNVTRSIKCPNQDCDAKITKLYGGIWSSYEFKYHRKESWDNIDIYSDNADLKMRENYRLTIHTYQTELIGKLVDTIWSHLINSKPGGNCQEPGEEHRKFHLRYFNYRNTNWETDNTDGKQYLMEACELAKKFEEKIKELMAPNVYNPDKYGLPSLDYYL